MTSYKPLSDADVRDISSAYFSERQAKTQEQERPAIVLVGGQPGAGKSAAAALVRSEFAVQGGFIHVDADRMRERIPIGDSKPTSEQTQADAGRLANALRELAIQGQRNIVEEGTFRKADDAAKRIQSLQDKGYKVELLVVATPREESLLGIYQRHEQQHATGASNPRFVSESYHEEAMSGFDATVAKTAAQFDRVRVVNRAGAVLYDSATPQSNSQANALEAMVAARKLTDAKLTKLNEAWAVVEAGAEARGAPPAYLEAVARQRQQVKEITDDRIHAHAMRQLNANLAVLGKDARYAPHTNDELVKAAYFRGFHEKAREFEGKPPNFKMYDATIADRTTLAQLPGIVDLEGHAAPPRQHRRQDHEGRSL